MAFLAIDTASPTVSLALGDGEESWATESMPQTRSSRRLLPALDSLLTACGQTIEELEGIVVVRGPGSFTGMRVGLATVLGLHQATGVRCAAVSTLTALAACATGQPGGEVLAVVDALRDEWFVQSYGAGLPPEARAEPHRRSTAELAAQLAGTDVTVVGHAEQDPQGRLQIAAERCLAVGALAPVLLKLAPTVSEWRWQDLTEPLYLRSPAVTLPTGQKKAP